jgi:uncharacterized protein (TIGR02453 family)
MTPKNNLRTDRIMAFLKAIKENNNRPYFQEHKAEYEAAKKDFEDIVTELIAQIAEKDSTIAHLTAKDCIYRFYRDIRFSPDKSPYKRHFGAFIAPQGGHKSLISGYYLHLQPGESMLVTGTYILDKNQLHRMRDMLYGSFEEFKDIIDKPDFKKTFGDVTSMFQLKKMPIGYPADCEGAQYMKYKDFIALRNLTDEEVLNADFAEKASLTFRTSIPFNLFINDTLTRED